MKIVLLGSGNLATHLGPALQNVGHELLQVWSRNEVHAKILADKLHAEAISKLANVSTDADLYLIAVKDDAIRKVAEGLPINSRLVVHTSGSSDLSIFEGIAYKYGVLYPAQTFSKVKEVDFKTIPISIEGNSAEVLGTLRNIARSLSNKVVEMNSIQRKVLHLAAVFACNFTNHLYHIADQLLTNQGLDFDLLRPIILETAEKIQSNRPKDVQTGPAVRNDRATMDKHIQLLAENPQVLALYQDISRFIIACK